MNILKKTSSSQYSTVLIVNKDGGTPRYYQVPATRISRLPFYLAGIVLVVLMLLIYIFYVYFNYRKSSLENQRLAQQLNMLSAAANCTSVPIKPVGAADYIQHIQSKIAGINRYLSDKNISGFSNYAIGGGKHPDSLSELERYSLYNEYVSRLLVNFVNVPLGYPRQSNITSFFGFRSDPFESGHAEFHPGIDFAGAKGDPVKCTANGRVAFAGWAGSYGNCIRINHENSFETLFGHLSKINVKVGQQVTIGEIIGAVGSTGRSTAAHLHYEIRKNGKPIDPRRFLTIGDH